MTEKIEGVYFSDLAYVESKISDNLLQELKKQAKYVLDNQNYHDKYNSELAGNLENEFDFSKYQNLLKPTVVKLANKYWKIKHNTTNYPSWFFNGFWINFQKKYEHNPLHNHSGFLSFVLWIQIPYNLEDELNALNSKNSNAPTNSLFQFSCVDYLGRIKNRKIEVDKSYEGTIIMFDSQLYHQVYPFHTSDDYRISISGNLIIKNPEKNKTNFLYQ